MVDIEEAKKIAMKRINSGFPADFFDSDDAAVIMDAYTITKPYGWVFSYSSKKFLETNNFSYHLIGNGPILVLKRDGSIVELGTAETIEVQLQELEKKMSL